MKYLAVLTPLLFAASAQATTALSNGVEGGCAHRLANTLEVLEARSPLKEEHATGIMWLRLDAEVALESGDEALCIEKIAVVENLLGVN